jgi:hypothetical protein
MSPRVRRLRPGLKYKTSGGACMRLAQGARMWMGYLEVCIPVFCAHTGWHLSSGTTGGIMSQSISEGELEFDPGLKALILSSLRRVSYGKNATGTHNERGCSTSARNGGCIGEGMECVVVSSVVP